MVPGNVQPPRLSWDSGWKCWKFPGVEKGVRSGGRWLVAGESGPVLFCSSLPSWPMLGWT